MIYPREVDALVAEFQYLQQQPYVKADKIGYIGVSVGSPLALLAAADPRINNDVAYAVSFGGYYDADRRPRGRHDRTRYPTTASRRAGQPDQHSVDVMSEQVINRLNDASDRDILTRALVDQKPDAIERPLAAHAGRPRRLRAADEQGPDAGRRAALRSCRRSRVRRSTTSRSTAGFRGCAARRSSSTTRPTTSCPTRSRGVCAMPSRGR